MPNFLSRIRDSRLEKIVDCVPLGDEEEFRRVKEDYPEYDTSFLWLLSYSREDMPKNRTYVEEAYKKFHQVLDGKFPKTMATKGNFASRMWELILCDCLSASGELKPKAAKGADFILRIPTGQDIQIEAIAPNESEDIAQRAVRPDYTQGNMATFGGEIHEMERPIALRFLHAFSKKKDNYQKGQPLIIAINSSKVVGFTSDDTYILRRILFGLGNWTMTRDGQWSFEQLPIYNKLGEQPFPVAYFRRPEFSHISAVIYSSQNPLGFIPGGYSWHNSGITIVPNPSATHPVTADFPFFNRIFCDASSYQQIAAQKPFESVIVSSQFDGAQKNRP